MVGILGASGAAIALLGATSAPSISVSGAVKQPGELAITRTQTLNEAIRQMGGFRQDADKRKVKIVSLEGEERLVDLTRLGTIPTVHPGERVIVPAIDPATSVVVQGSVSRPGAVEFRPGMTVTDALAEAEPNKRAPLDAVRVLRRADDGTVQVLQADLLAMHAGKTAPLTLRAGDTVAVPYSNTQMSDRDLLTIVVIGLLILVILN
jgi:protein involved in polysaccharide export with SLBB domain